MSRFTLVLGVLCLGFMFAIQFRWFTQHVKQRERWAGTIMLTLIGTGMIFVNELERLPDRIQVLLILAVAASALVGLWPLRRSWRRLRRTQKHPNNDG